MYGSNFVLIVWKLTAHFIILNQHNDMECFDNEPYHTERTERSV